LNDSRIFETELAENNGSLKTKLGENETKLFENRPLSETLRTRYTADDVGGIIDARWTWSPSSIEEARRESLQTVPPVQSNRNQFAGTTQWNSSSKIRL
jgi:hypothetical protein